jgi:tripartite-type tricarboxylate transporter receptor subunit TctC
MKTLAFLVALCGLAIGPAAAQTYPDHPIRLIVPYTPGGQFDIHARMIADRMSPKLGQPVLIENKPGAGTMLAADYVAKQKNDGYTILFSGANMFAIAPHVYRNVPYKTSDFQTISMVSELPMGFVVNTNVLPVKDFKELIAYAKANPGKVSFGTSGTGGAQHLLGELAKMRAGIDIVHVGYRGTGQAIQDLLGGQIPMASDGLVAYIPHTKDGGPLRILGVSSRERMVGIPDVPTFAEQGFPDLTVASWGGFVAPAGTPKEIIDKLHDAIVAADNAPDVQERIVKDAAVPRTSTPAEFDAVIAADYARWGEVVKKLNLKLD